MKTRQLGGQTGPVVSELGLGCMGLSFGLGPAADKQDGLAMIRSAHERGGRKKSSPAQIALAWLLAQRPWIVPNPGATKLEHLDDNLAASDLQLTTGDLGEIDAAFAAIDVKGAPLSEGLTSMEDR